MRRSISLFVLVVILAALAFSSWLPTNRSASAGQGKGGEVIAKPTPTPTPKKTTTAKKATPRRSPATAKPTAEIDRKLAELKKRRNALLVTRTAENPEVKDLDAQIASLEKQREELLGKTAGSGSTVSQPTGDLGEIAFWESIKNSTDPEDFKAYLKKYPNGQFTDLAQNSLRRLEAAKSSSSPTSTNPNSTNPNSPTSSPSKTAMPPNPPLPLHSFDFVTVTLDKEGKLKNRETKSAQAYTEDFGGGVKLEMVAIPPGEFMMGSPETEANRSKDEGPQHRVRINYLFYMGKFEVTQAEWRAVMGNDPSYFKNCDECPVEQVSWNDATEFCRKLSARTGRDYRLPSEAEWEYAARAGTTTPFAFGDTITPEVVNYEGNYPYANAAKGTYRQKTVPGGSLGVANAFGLYDMHGNVWEWCQDWYHDSYSAIAGDAPTDGSTWVTGSEQKGRVLRGGSWDNFAYYSRSAARVYGTPVYRVDIYGFRVVVAARTQ